MKKGNRFFQVLPTVHAVVILGRLVWLPSWPYRAIQGILSLLPSAHVVGLRCCDNGGRPYAWVPVFSFNEWHRRSIEVELDRSSDGPAIWQRVKFIHLFKRVES